jgi:hypothetical protein
MLLKKFPIAVNTVVIIFLITFITLVIIVHIAFHTV